MKQGLSLRVSQHLALTPQLQQSIRLLQLSTLELSQEVEQMLDENPFLERTAEEAAREEFGLDTADAPVPRDDAGEGEAEFTPSAASTSSTSSDTTTSTPDSDGPAAEIAEREPDWEGDGTVDMAPDDSEWGSDAPARQNNLGDDERADATELARSQESLQSFLHRQALSLRLNENDCAALRFLIESLNDDGYLEDSLPALASGLAGDDNDQFDDLVHHFQVALGLLQSLEPVGVGARDLGECLSIQLKALASEDETEAEALIRKTAIAICKQPMELLARRDFKRLATLTRTNDCLLYTSPSPRD